MSRREFTVANEYQYNHRSPLRWLSSHIMRYPILVVTFLLTTIGMAASQSMSAVMVGRAVDTVIRGAGAAALTVAALLVVSAYVAYGLFDIVNSMAIRVLAQRVERDARQAYEASCVISSSRASARELADLGRRAFRDERYWTSPPDNAWRWDRRSAYPDEYGLAVEVREQAGERPTMTVRGSYY